MPTKACGHSTSSPSKSSARNTVLLRLRNGWIMCGSRPSGGLMKRLPSLLLALVLHADEGMWTFNKFPVEKLRAKYGFAPSQEWLDHVRLSSVRWADEEASESAAGVGSACRRRHVDIQQVPRRKAPREIRFCSVSGMAGSC